MVPKSPGEVPGLPRRWYLLRTVKHCKVYQNSRHPGEVPGKYYGISCKVPRSLDRKYGYPSVKILTYAIFSSIA